MHMEKRNGEMFVRELLSRGRYVFSREEAAQELQRDGDALWAILRRLEKTGWTNQIVRGFYCVVPPQQKNAGTIPPEWFVDELARFLGVEYYVGGLTAALFHGASHQKPQIFQVVADRQLRGIRQKNMALDFFFRKPLPKEYWVRKKTITGYFRMSSPEATACDLVAYRRMCGSPDFIATVFVELGDALRPDRLAALVPIYELPVMQRVGWLLDFTGWKNKTQALNGALRQKPLSWQRLRSGAAVGVPRDERWKILVNCSVEPDIEPVEHDA